MAGATAQTKTIRVAVDSSQAVASVNNLHAAFASLSGTNPGLAQLVQNLQNVQNAANGAAGAGGGGGAAAATQRFGALGQSAQAAMQRLSGLTGTMGGVATAGLAMGVTAGVGALVALGTAAVNASAKMEAYKASLTTVLGSSEKASAAFDHLVQFAAKTPFSLDQSVQGFIKLRALGLQPSERAMMSYGNTASAMGKDMNQMVEAVADAATGEFERLKEFGIKSSKQGNDVAFTFQGVTTKVKNNSAEIQEYLMKIGEVNFGGAMARQMETFNGAMSNLEDTWMQTLAAIGDGGLTKSVAGIINMINSGLVTISPLLVGIGNAMSGLVSGFGSIISGFGEMFSAISTGGGQSGGILEALTFQFNMIGQVAQVAGTIIGGVFSAIGGLVTGVSDMIGTAFGAVLSWLGVKFESSGRSWGNAIFGVMRAVKAVAMQMPAVFKIAVSDVMGMFRTLGQAIGALLSGNWAQAKALANKPLFTNTSKALGAVGRIGMATYRDEKGADAAMNRMFGRNVKVDKDYKDDYTAPKPGAAAGGKDDAAKKAAEKAKRENEFWETLKNELATAQVFGIEAQKLTKEKELHKILERDLSAAEKTRVDTMVQEIANAKALTDLRQGSFDLENKITLAKMRATGLTEDQSAIQDALDAKMLSALASGVSMGTIQGQTYQTELARYRTLLEQNQALDKQRELLKGALDTARGFAAAYGNGFDVKRLQDQLSEFTRAFAAGEIKDAWGNPLATATADAIKAGFANGIAEATNKPMMDALGAAAGSSVTAAAQLARMNAGADRDKATRGLAAAGLSPEQYERATREIANDYRDKMVKANNMVADDFTDSLVAGLDDLAERFGGVFGSILKSFSDLADKLNRDANGTSGTAKLMTLISDKLGNGFKEAAQGMQLTPANMKAAMASIGDPIKSLKAGFDPAQGGSFLKGMGKAVGGAMQGYEIGSTVAGLGKMLGANKGFQTGSKIGGTIGGLTGNPIIAAGASLIGGLIGSLFSKAPKGAAVITGGTSSSITGNKGSVRDALTGASNSIQSSLQAIATQLGGTVGGFMVSIGKYKDNYRVSGTGASNVDTKKTKKISGLIYDGKDEAAAIAVALQNAIADGAIQGIAGYVQGALQQAGTEAAVALYNGVKEVTSSLDSMLDPIGASAREIVNPVNALIAQMQKYGATSEDVSKMEQYKTLKLKAALKDQLSSINDFMKSLRNDDSVSDFDKLKNSLTSFDTMKAQIAAGDSSLNQSDFTALGQEIMSLSQAVYGTSTAQYQDIRSMLTESSTSFADMITRNFNSAADYDVNASTVSAIDATTSAINAQTNAIVAQQTVMTDYLAQIAANSANDNAGGYTPDYSNYSPYLRNKLESMNGEYVGNIY